MLVPARACSMNMADTLVERDETRMLLIDTKPSRVVHLRVSQRAERSPQGRRSDLEGWKSKRKANLNVLRMCTKNTPGRRRSTFGVRS